MGDPRGDRDDAGVHAVLDSIAACPPRRNALGLAFFTIAGVQIAQQAGHSDPIALLMGTITGVAGGVLRDVLTAEIPLIFRPGRLYATAALAGAGIYVLLAGHGVSMEAAGLAGMGATAGLRLAAIFWRLELPAVKLPDDEPQ